jgi:tRNA-2-methylthio-N6-dimethylallyladenosine synthase
MNVNESEKITGLLSKAGYHYVTDLIKSDIIIVNTCTVRQKSAEKVYGFIGRTIPIRKTNSRLKLGVCGCLAEAENKNLLKRKGVDFVFGTRAYPNITDIVEKAVRGERFVDVGDYLSEETSLSPIKRLSSHHAWITIIYGCDRFCSYCIVPYTRGREKSRAFSDVCSEIALVAEQGYREITFLGQNVDAYGKDFDMPNPLGFSDVLAQAARTEGIERVWFMTSYPSDFSDAAIAVIAQNRNIARAIHLPLQSGSNTVLRNMNRKYTREEYLDLIARVRKSIPEAALSTDIIVGFPGESEEDFEDSVRLVESVRFERLNLAMYSPRDGTVAQKTMEDTLPYSLKNSRLQILLELQKRINKDINQASVGEKLWMLAENQTRPFSGMIYGRTDRNRIIIVKADTDLIGHWVEVEIGKATAGPLYGTIVRSKP